MTQIASVGGQTGSGTKAIHHASAKTALISLTRSRAKIFAPYGVGLPDDVATAALSLASEESSYVAGYVLNVNCGVQLGRVSLGDTASA